MQAEFDRPWWQHKHGARYKRLGLDGYAGEGVGDDALANNCAKILDGLLRQDLGIAAGSFFSHAVRAANGMLPQSVIEGIDYVRQQRNDVMHTLGIFRLQDPGRFASCVNAALDAIERAAAARRRGGAVHTAGAPPARGGGSLASGGGQRASQLTASGFQAQQPAAGLEQQPPQQRRRQQQQPGAEQREQQQEVLEQRERQQERQREQQAARWVAETAAAAAAAAGAVAEREEAAAEQEAAELRAAEEASRREAERRRREEAEFEAQLAAALQASLCQQGLGQHAAVQQLDEQSPIAEQRRQQGMPAPAAADEEQQQQQQQPTPRRQDVVDLTADSDGPESTGQRGPPAKRRRCCEAEAELQGQLGWVEGSPCDIVIIGSQ